MTSYNFRRSAMALLVALLALSAPAQTLVYYADAERSDNLGDGRSWATAKRTLQAAIDATTTAHQVWAKVGSYQESVRLRSGVGLYGGFSGRESRPEDRGTTATLTVIDASHARSGQPAYHAVVMDSVTSVSLEGFKITGGQAYGNPPDCNGGGIFCQNLDASTTISHCLITGNTAAGGRGAGIACMTASPVITDCAILNNTVGYSGSNNGGGISCQQSSPLIRRCTIAGNYAYYNGGGLHLQQSAPNLLECTIAANWTRGAYSDNHGGGLYCDQSPAVIESCRISGNSAYLDGGGLYLDHCSPALLNCVLSGNAAVNGGAMRCYYASPRIINCTLSDNTAQTSGGAVYCQFDCVPVISNTIFSGNTPRAICDLWAYSSVPPTLSRSLFFDNAGGDYCDESGAIHTGANDLNMNVAGTERNIEGDPRFAAGLAGRWTAAAKYDASVGGTRLTDDTARLTPGALQGALINPDAAQKRQTLVLDNSTTTVLVAGDVSGFVQSGDPWKVCDYHLADGSPALDRAALQDAPLLDLEGDPRPGSDGRADIGADEAAAAFQPATDTTPPVSEPRGTPALVYTTAIDLPFAASDEASGLKEVRLFYRRNGGAWAQYPDAATTFSLAASPVHFNAGATGGEGHYEFYTQATDNAGNTEARPAMPDADVVVITSPLTGSRLYVDRSAPGAANGSDWANACHEVGTALALAVKFGIPEIWVAGGVYPEHITLASKVAVYGGFQGYGGARETALAQRDPRQNKTTLDPRGARGGAGTGSVVTMNGITSACLDGFIITGGSATGAWPQSRGGGIFANNLNTSNRIVQCTIRGNTAVSGGGISLNTASPRIQQCTIAGNIASDTGGGIACYGSAAEITSCTIAGNLAQANNAGGLGGYQSDLTITACTISGNTTWKLGGGLHFNGGTSIMQNCVVSGNRCDGTTPSYGGESGNAGGGIGFWAQLSLINCVIDQNTAPLGGGIQCESENLQASPPVLRNTIITSNTGTAIYVAHSDSAPVPVNCLLYGNSGGDYAIRYGAVLTGANAINLGLSGASGNVGGDPLFTPGPTGTWSAVQYDPVEHCTLLTSVAGGLTPGALRGMLINPNLAQARQALVLENTTTTLQVAGDATGFVHGGDAWRTMDYHIQSGSAALGRGALAGAPTIDFEGDARPGADGLVDIGADEAQTAGTSPTDHTPPVSYTHDVPAYLTTATFSIPFIASDDESGLKEIRLSYRLNGGPWTQYPDTATTYSATAGAIAFDSSLTGGDGRYDFYTLATDNAGNTEAPPASPDSTVIITTHFPGSRIYVNAGATGVESGEDWSHGYHSIKAALDAAVRFGVKEIWVARGRYVESLKLVSGVALYGGFAGSEASIAARNIPANPTVIDVLPLNTPTLSCGAVVMAGVSAARLDGFTLTGGRAYDINAERDGAGIYCKDLDSTSVIENCTIMENEAYVSGGGIYCRNASPAIRNCLIWGNRASYSGGIYLDNSSPRVEHCRIMGNSDGYDGAVACYGGAPEFRACTVSGNSGPGIAAHSSNSMQILNCLISGNYQGIYCESASPLINGCTIADNTQDGIYCGAFYSQPGSCPVIRNSILGGNGLFGIHEDDINSDPWVYSCLFVNDPTSNGGYFDERQTVLPDAAAINAKPDGRASGNISGASHFTMGLCGAWTASPAYDSASQHTTLTIASAELIPGTLTGRLITPTLNEKQQAIIVDNTTTTIIVAGRFDANIYKGTRWQLPDYHLGYGSAAIDAVTSQPLPTDLDGNPRPVDIAGHGAGGTGTEFDLGAYEAQAGRPRLSVISPDIPLNFGTQDIEYGVAKPQAVTIANTGFGPLTFTGAGAAIVGRDAREFSFTSATLATPLSPGATRAFSLTFDPSTTGTKAALLRLSTNDPATPELDFPLTGTGAILSPLITTQPAALAVIPDASATFTVAARGVPPLSYQWLFNEKPLANDSRISGATAPQLIIRHVSKADLGNYVCRVTNRGGTTRSAAAALTLKSKVRIVSSYGTPSPAVGEAWYANNQWYEFTMTTPTVSGPASGVRYACTGWTLAGQSTQSGWGTSCRFYLTGDLTLTWNWTLQYQFQAAATPIWGGGVYPPSGWVNVNQTVDLKASPALNFRFANWSGDATGTSTTLTLKMDRAKTVTARFERLANAYGTVRITVWPPAAGWSLADSDLATRQGNGPVRLDGVAAGPVTVNWLPPAGYAAPVPLQVTKTLAAQGEVAFTEVFVPKAAGMSRTAALILRYLLGLSTDPTGLDVNGDGKVNIADLQWANERALPNPTILPKPADGATNVSVNATLSWAAVPHASRYNLYLWKAAQARPATPTVSGLAASAFRPASPLAFMTDYRWMVVSMNANGMTTGSVWRFTTDRNR